MISLLSPDDSEMIMDYLESIPDEYMKNFVSIDIMSLRMLIFYNKLVFIGDYDNSGIKKLMVISTPNAESPCRSLTLVYYTKDESFIQSAIQCCKDVFSDFYSKIKINLNDSKSPRLLLKCGFVEEVGFKGKVNLHIYSYFFSDAE